MCVVFPFLPLLSHLSRFAPGLSLQWLKSKTSSKAWCPQGSFCQGADSPGRGGVLTFSSHISSPTHQRKLAYFHANFLVSNFAGCVLDNRSMHTLSGGRGFQVDVDVSQSPAHTPWTGHQDWSFWG